MTMCETSVRPIIPRLWLLSEQKCDDIIPVEWLDVPMKVGVEIKVSGRVAKRGEDCLVMTAKNDEDIFLFFSPDFCSTLSIRDTTGRVFVIGFTFTERAMYIMRVRENRLNGRYSMPPPTRLARLDTGKLCIEDWAKDVMRERERMEKSLCHSSRG